MTNCAPAQPRASTVPPGFVPNVDTYETTRRALYYASLRDRRQAAQSMQVVAKGRASSRAGAIGRPHTTQMP